MIDAVLCSALAQQAISKQCILDIGTGSGHIAAHFSAANAVTAADIENQMVVPASDFQFTRITGAQLPFATGQFDIAILNQVLTYVPDQHTELAEVHRVLKPDGVCFISLPNRLFPLEPHTHIPLIHYLPHRPYNRLLAWRKGVHENVRMHTPGKMRALFASTGFTAQDCTVDVLHDPARYRGGKGPRFPRWNWLAWLSPTNIFILRKTQAP